MTYACGAACADGVVLASDSMWMLNVTEGQKSVINFTPAGGKIGWVGDRIAFIPAGTWNLGVYPSRQIGNDLEIAPVETIARQLHAKLEAHRIPRLVSSEKGLAPMSLLVAGGPEGATPQLAHIACESSSPELVSGRIVFEGSLYYFARSSGLQGMRAPSSVDAAVPLVVSLCWAAMRFFYARCGYTRLSEFPGIRGERLGGIPNVAFPLNVAVITPSEIREYEIPELSEDEEGAAAYLLRSYGLTQLPFNELRRLGASA